MAFVFRNNYDRPSLIVTEPNVGPASYRFLGAQEVQSAAPFNSSQRKAIKSMSTGPGPGHYQICQHQSNKVKRTSPCKLSVSRNRKKIEALPNQLFQFKLPQLKKKRSPKKSFKLCRNTKSTPSIPSKIIPEKTAKQETPKEVRISRKSGQGKPSLDLNFLWQFLRQQKSKQFQAQKEPYHFFKVIHVYKVQEILKQTPNPSPGPGDYYPERFQPLFKSQQRSEKFQFFLNGSPRFKKPQKGVEEVKPAVNLVCDVKKQIRKKLKLSKFNHYKIVNKLFSPTPAPTIHKTPHEGKIFKLRAHTLPPPTQKHSQPGPGAYQPFWLQKKKRRQTFQEQIMSSLKPLKNKSQEPSPLSYFKERYKSIAAQRGKLNFPPFMSRSIRFSQAKKSISRQKILIQQPLSSRSSEGCKFQMAPKESIFSIPNKVPGPGTYFRRPQGGLLSRSFNKLFNKI